MPPRVADSARAYAALDELLREGMVQQRHSWYVLGQRTVDDALLRVTDEDARRRSHQRLARIFEQPAYPDRMLPVRQLQLAGEHARACELLVEEAKSIATGPMDWGLMRVSVLVECVQNGLVCWQAHGGCPCDGIRLRWRLLTACSVYDWALARFGDAQLARLRADSGMVHWDETDASLPPLQRLFECLRLAQLEYDQKPEAERGFPPGDSIRELAACAMPLSGAFVNSHDVAHARSLVAVVDPLRSLSPLLVVLADLCELAVDRVSGREFGERVRISAQRLRDSMGFPEVLRLGGASIYLHIQAMEDA